MGRLEELLSIASKNLVDGNLEEAIRNYNLALTIEGNNTFALGSLGMAHYKKGEFQQAERFYQYALEAEPDNAVIINKLAETYLEQNKFNEASKVQSKILARTPENIRARVGLGHSYRGMKRYDDAIREYSTVVKQGLKARVNLGWMHLFSGKRYDRASQIQQRIIERCDIALAYWGLIEVHIEKKEYSQSSKYLSELNWFKWKTRMADFLYSLKP